MISRRITIADVANVTGITRHRLRNLLNELPDFKARKGRARVAHEYSEQDLVVLTVCVELEEKFGLRRDVVASLATGIRLALSGPKLLANGASLEVVPWEGRVSYLVNLTKLKEGLVLPLDGVVRRIDAYLQLGQQQRPLNLGPVAVGATDQSANARANVRGMCGVGGIK